MELLCVSSCLEISDFVTDFSSHFPASSLSFTFVFSPLSRYSLRSTDRLENEHIGNMDQYRVTREVPLPYSIEDAGRYSDDDDDSQSRKSVKSAKSLRWRMSMRRGQSSSTVASPERG